MCNFVVTLWYFKQLIAQVTGTPGMERPIEVNGFFDLIFEIRGIYNYFDCDIRDWFKCAKMQLFAREYLSTFSINARLPGMQIV